MREFVLKYKVPLIVLASILAMLIAIRSIRFVGLIDKKGVYVIAAVTEVRQNKSGYYVDAYFWAKDKKQKIIVNFSFFTPVVVGDKFFVKAVLEDPEFYEVIRDVPIPHCYDNEQGMKMTWKEIPDCRSLNK
jgi:hypothetical protein